MAGLGNLFQKAVYLGVGIASYTGEKVSQNLGEIKEQAQTLADELVQRGEMTTEEARKMVDDLVNQAQVTTVEAQSADEAPRNIQIELDDDQPVQSSKPSDSSTAKPAGQTPQQQQADALRQQVEDLQAQLEKLKRS